jgi:hypothetical protein
MEYLVTLNRDDELFVYLDATDAYQRDGDRPALLRGLLTLGLPADQIRWHGEHRGETMVVSS